MVVSIFHILFDIPLEFANGWLYRQCANGVIIITARFEKYRNTEVIYDDCGIFRHERVVFYNTYIWYMSMSLNHRGDLLAAWALSPLACSPIVVLRRGMMAPSRYICKMK